MRVLRSFILASTTLAAAVTSAEGQVTLYAGGTYTEALGGQWGADARLGYNFIALPVEVYAGADYFLTECEGQCGLWGWRVGGDLRLPIPGLVPYVSGAWVRRELELGSSLQIKEGVAVGGGLSLEAGIRIRAEVFREFLGGDLDQFVFKVGLGLR